MNNINLINASAGSGKTHRLTTMVVEAIENGLSPESLMATTFTIKAASELKERIRIQLLKNKKYDEASRINDGFIGTVNSICARLLKEYAIEAGISPAVDVISEDDSIRIFKIAIDNVIKQYAEKMEPAAHRLGLDGSRNGYKSNADWRDNVKTIMDLARSNRIMPDELRNCSKYSWQSMQSIFGEPIKTDLNCELNDSIIKAISYLDNLGNLTKTTQNSLEKLKEYCRLFGTDRFTWGEWISLAKLGSAKDGKDVINKINSVASHVLKHPQFQADVKQIIEGSFECAGKALESYELYKKINGLMDFVDQETLVLDMAQHNDAFRTSIKDRIQILMVDEFQDTSPIQLALFLTLDELAGKSVWVGDPKQAIYGFRGTDPQLMSEIVSLIKNSQILDYSWRSKEKLLNFTNAVFSEVFHSMGKEKVCLKIPDERTEKAKGGWLETWHLMANNNPDEAAATAIGVKKLIERIADINPGDIAVLCRTNSYCTKVATELENLGIRASVEQGLLLDTKECKAAIAALRYMNNAEDTLALTEIIHLSSKYKSNEDWLAELMANPEETKKNWQLDPLIAPLNEGRNNVKHWSPIEALEQAISRINLINLIKSWENPRLARSNLDALRGTCREYVNQCTAHRSAATIEGFISYLSDSEMNQAQGAGPQTVKVLTYHGAKGLEWPWVILTGLNNKPIDDTFGVHVEVATQFNPAEPLNDRRIRYWPWSFGSFEPLDEKIDVMPIKKIIMDKSEREQQRLLYVGMTRAKDGLVMSIRKTINNSGASLKTTWLDVLKDSNNKCVLNFSLDLNNQIINIGSDQISITVIEYEPEISDITSFQSEDEFSATLPVKVNEHPIARISPSSLEADNSETDNIVCKTIKNFNKRISINGKPEMNLIGSAVHTYLATDYNLMTDDVRIALIQKILRNWNVDIFINPQEILLAGQNLSNFIEENYKGCKTFKEWPISMRNQSGQLLQGWIDLLIETPTGYVIIDHKDYPGKDAEEYIKKYAPQLKAYKQSVERSTRKPVIDMLIYLPVSGQVIKFELSEKTELVNSDKEGVAFGY